MNDYIRSTFGRSMRIVSCHYNPMIYSETDLRSSTVGNIPASIKLHQQHRHRRLDPALGILRRQPLLRLHPEQLLRRELR